MSAKVQQFITAKIIELLESGEKLVWQRPWRSGLHQHLVSKVPYRGVNQVICGLTAIARGYSSPYWASLKQILERGGRVKESEFATPTPIVFWRRVTYKVNTEDGDAEAGEQRTTLIPCKWYRVYNLDQATGIEVSDDIKTDAVTPIERVESLVSSLSEQPDIRRGGDRACYFPQSDYIQLPDFLDFRTAEQEAETRIHEICHWTGHPTRLNRSTLTQASYFGSEIYSEEEITVELATCWILANAGIDANSTKRCAAYIKSFCDHLRRDYKYIFSCATQSQRIFDFIVGKPDENSGAAETSALDTAIA